MHPKLLTEELPCQNGLVGIATLNAPRSLNALDFEMASLLKEQLLSWQERQDVKAVLLKGSGEKAFCAGGDIRSLQQRIVGAPDTKSGLQAAGEFFTLEYTLDHLIHTYKKPVVALGNGIVMGGGLGLFVGASHRVVTPSTTIAMPEITIGFFPDVGATWFLNRLPSPLGLFMGLTGARLGSEDALFLGLADFKLSLEAIDAFLDQLKNCSFKESAQENQELITSLLQNNCLSPQLSKHSAVCHNIDAIYDIFSQKTLEKIEQKLTNINAEAVFLSQCASTFLSGSKLSACIVWEQMKRGRHFSLAQAFAFETHLAKNLVSECRDFVEGVRALLIDKDKNPKWSHQSFSDARILAKNIAEAAEAQARKAPL